MTAQNGENWKGVSAVECDQITNLRVRGRCLPSHPQHKNNIRDCRDSKSRWSLLSGVYARGSKRSHSGGKCVTCRGLHILA